MTEQIREKLNLTLEQARAILYDDADPPEFDIISEEIVDQDRWTVTYKLIIRRISDGKFFRDYFRRGATEYQDESPWEYDKPNFKEVFPVEKTITVYE